MKKLFLDIETLPAEGANLDLVKRFWEEGKKKQKFPVKKGENDFESFFRNTSFQGELGRILCIAYAVDDQPVECLFGNEKEILKNFWEIAKDATLFIGHNILDFDLRFIYKRSVINGIKPSRELSFARYRSEPIFDTMKEWEKWASAGVSLHKLSIVLGVQSPKEEGIDGALVYDYYLQNRSEEIYLYCKRDVSATREVYKKISFLQ